MSKLWITSLAKDEARVQRIMIAAKRYGLDGAGHFWADDLEKLAWVDVREQMLKAAPSCWFILATAAELALPSVRYGLSLVALGLSSRRALPIVILLPGEESVNPAALPTPLAGASVLSEANPWQAKLVARANLPVKAPPSGYRIDVYGNPQYGQWFEVGPSEGNWDGALFAVADGEITFQAVGPRGALPESTVLNFAQQGLGLELGGRAFTAWAVRNPIAADQSHYVRVKGAPDALLFGAYPEAQDAECFRLNLK